MYIELTLSDVSNTEVALTQAEYAGVTLALENASDTITLSLLLLGMLRIIYLVVVTK